MHESPDDAAGTTQPSLAELRQEVDNAAWKRPRELLDYLKTHPAIGATILYVYVSFLGSTYNWMFLRRFDINFFDFAETNDFLTGALKEPFVLVQGALGVGLFLVLLRGLAARRKLSEMILEAKESLPPERVASLSKRRRRVLLNVTTIIMVIVYTFGPGFVLAGVSSGRTQEGWGSYVRVGVARPMDTETSLPDNALMLLGTTDSFVFLYDRANEKTHILPTANLAEMSICRVRLGLRGWGLWPLRLRPAPTAPCQP